tara:strand:+ start:3478 stop:6096 length:2619 start_codon:yes stop_codon:yes gene_type:complete
MDLQYYINKLNYINFSDKSIGKLLQNIENLLNNITDYSNYTKELSMVCFFYTNTHNYYKFVHWYNKIVDKSNEWNILFKINFNIISNSQDEEDSTINMLKNNFDELLNQDNININNLMLFSYSFWYAYLDVNPIELYKRNSNLQIKCFPTIANNNLLNYNFKNSKIKVGIISGQLEPISQNFNIHSSSISDSFYKTFLDFSKDVFEIIFIYYGKKNPNIINDKNVYIDNIRPNTTEILKTQKKISNLNLDILLFLDLHMQTELNFIGLSKLAKIQICTHGHPVTSGIPRNIMNYYISWEAAEIENAQQHYTEELILIPKNIVWEHFIPRNLNNEISLLTGNKWSHIKRSDMNFIPNVDKLLYKNWYFCAQATFKLHHTFDIILKNILNNDENGIIILIKNDKELYNIGENFEKRIINKELDLQRIFIIEKLKHHEMMALYNNIDVALDSFFFGGDTTSREAFEVGTPIITLPYKYLGSRWTYAYYNCMGITELIATDLENYSNLAVTVGTNKQYSKKMRQKIKENNYKIFYSKDSTKEWEKIFINLYNKHCKEINISNKNLDKIIDNKIIDNKIIDKNKPCGGTELVLKLLHNFINIKEIKYNIITTSQNDIIFNNKKSLYLFHDSPDDPKYNNINFDNNDNIYVFVSNYQYNEFINYRNINKKKCYVIKNPIIPIPYHIKNNDVCNIIYHSTPHRGLDILITVFEKLIPLFINNNINVHLSVYSSFDLYNRSDLNIHFNEIFDKIKNNPCMTYYKNVSNHEIRNALVNSNIFAYPSTFPETSCLCLIEAMSAGCICVHSSLAALPETANCHTMMYEYCEDKFNHCTIFAEKLIEAVINYKNINTNDQIYFANNEYNIYSIIKQWNNLFQKL